MYRAVALVYLERGLPPTAQHATAILKETRLEAVVMGGDLCVLLNGEDVRSRLWQPEVSRVASVIGAFSHVRTTLVAFQRHMGVRYRHDPGVVAEGRDIGTVVFPDAEVKLFMTADPAVRARRRLAELQARGKDLAYDTILSEILARDQQDRERALSPLRQASDAVVLDTAQTSFEAQVEFILHLIGERTS